jgi:hypothetical protein
MRRTEAMMRITNRTISLLSASLLAAAAAGAANVDELKLEYHGAGWVQLGRIENTFSVKGDPNDYDENWLGNVGGVINTSTQIDEHWSGNFGIGTIMVQLPRGSIGQANKWYTFWVPFVSEAKLSYSTEGYAQQSGLQFNFGLQGYNYSPDAKNLGLYLMKGYVYPSTLESGFGNIFGVVAKASYGMFANDLIANLETDEKPLYDMSFADVVTLKLPAGIEIGAGVNFYRALPMDKKATSPGKDCNQNFLGPYAIQGQDNPCFIIEKDTAGNVIDTITGSLAGTKLMGRWRIDPKAWVGGSESLGKDDLVLYGEVALIGVKNYPVLYDKRSRRMPVMVGFNLPGFNFLNWSVEGEYYAYNLSGDNLGAQNGSWVSAEDPAVNTKRDNWKWSFNASKVLLGSMALSVQVANDHLRIGGNHDTAVGKEAMRTLEDWYWTSKLAYFF